VLSKVGSPPAIYVAIPKTATSSIVHTIPFESTRDSDAAGHPRGAMKHAPYAHQQAYYRTSRGIDITDRFSFTFIRNPWDRLVSEYLYRRWNPGTRRPATASGYMYGVKDVPKHINPFSSFVGFVKKIASDSNWYPETVVPYNWDHARRSQYEYICDENGKPAVDFIGRYETLYKDLDYICRQLNYRRWPLPHHNKAPLRDSYAEYYTDELREIVGKLYQQDIEYFGFKFEQK